MPRISIVVTAFNCAEYIVECLESLINQSYRDIEIVVSDDKSTDSTPDIIRKYLERDNRIKYICNEKNSGTVVTRKNGALHSTGDYVMFIDPDDTLDLFACEHLAAEAAIMPADILHFGVKVKAESNFAKDAAKGMESFMNPMPRVLTGEDILGTVFGDDGYDWNVCHKLFRGVYVREIFEDMPDVRLIQSEDTYIYFILASKAESYRSIANSQWYIYHLGRGVTLSGSRSVKSFKSICEQSLLSLQTIEDYLHSHVVAAMASNSLTELRSKLVQHAMNDWFDNVVLDDKEEALHVALDYWEPVEVCAELYRFVRDLSYRLATSTPVSDTDESMRLLDYLKSETSRINTSFSGLSFTKRFTTMKTEAENSIRLMADYYSSYARWSSSAIKIFVSSHISNAEYIDSNILQPVQVGSALHDHFAGTLHDDQGANISSKNPKYCELTTQYWAWKNVDAEYYGFCHYRRYFDFSSVEHQENAYGEIMDDYIDDDAIRRYGLDDKTISKVVAGYDVITTKYGDLSKIIGKHGTPAAVWKAAPLLHDEDLRRCYRILCEMHPEYKTVADAFLKGNRSCFCNMFIMRKEIFNDYCAWLFPILEEFEKQTDFSTYSKEALRTPGHLSERLLNIYLMYHKHSGSNWKTKELQCVHFTNPEPAYELKPLWDDILSMPQPVPVVFAADDNYVPQLTTTIYSAMKNASRNRFYDVVVLQRNIAWDKQERLRDFFKQFPNMNLRFTNVDRMMSGYKLSTNNDHISVETYYRFLIQEILPFYDKVLYLDSDMILTGDIAELYDTDLGDNMIGAVRDIDFLGNLNVKHGKRMGYAKETLQMRNPYDYFQAGVLVINTKALREHYTIQQWLDYATNSDFIYNDQDVLNAHCEGKVTFLPWEWDVVHDLENRVGRIFSQAPSKYFDEYMASRNNPKIIHYAGYIKPWTDPDCDFASVYWHYARETPFYERLLKRIAAAGTKAMAQQVSKIIERRKPARAVGEDNPLRKIIDPIAPIGSPQREIAKALGRAVRGRR